MTSEVVAMNRIGIALAADSVVSVYANGVHRKKHDSGAKLFMLSNVRPIGVMTFGDMSLLGVPWETIIKLFRKNLGHAKFCYVEQYGHKLIEFLKQQHKMFTTSVQQHYFLRKFSVECKKIKELYDARLENLSVTQTTGEDTPNNENFDMMEIIEQRLDEWNARKDNTELDEKLAEFFLEPVLAKLNNVMNQVFGQEHLTDERIERLQEIAIRLIYKLDWKRESYTGLVLGGFGEQEHFPAMQRINIGGMYNDALKWEGFAVQHICEEQPSYIESFAVNKAVDGFLTGMYIEYHQLLDAISSSIEMLPSSVLKQLENANEDVRPELHDSYEAMSNGLASIVRERVKFEVQHKKNKVLSVVEMLPLRELANVASTLVKLSSFEQQLSPHTEVVGGPIDVAVISKGDGFIWIDRKYYFKNELNYRYFDSVNREIRGSMEETDHEKGP